MAIEPENYLERRDMNSAFDECKRMLELDPNYYFGLIKRFALYIQYGGSYRKHWPPHKKV